MTKPLLLTLVVASLVFSSGCSLFSKKSSRPKESSSIAADVEETFRKRWVDRRVSELAAQGIAADAARPQAETEFREKYAFEDRRKK
jgi:CRISPR/Cas system-associated endonuclease Cas1